MERGKKTSFILKQFRKKSKQVVKKNIFTEFFYLNKDRKVIEFFSSKKILIVEKFFKEFLPIEVKDFISIKILNDSEEEISNWYYEEENLILIIVVNWGFKKQEMSVEINIENFTINILGEENEINQKVDHILLNDYFISLLTLRARSLAEVFKNLKK